MKKIKKEDKQKILVLKKGKETCTIGLKTESACLMCGINNPDNR